VDEIQTIFWEISFCHSYHVLPTLIKDYPKLQVFTLSGTLPLEVEKVMSNYLGMENCNTVRQPSIGLNGIFLGVMDGPLNFQTIATHCLACLDKGSLHAICSTKDICRIVADNILSDAASRNVLLQIITSDTHKEKRSQTCSEWSTGNCDILISTTC